MRRVCAVLQVDCQYMLRNMAETLQCNVMGYEYPGLKAVCSCATSLWHFQSRMFLDD